MPTIKREAEKYVPIVEKNNNHTRANTFQRDQRWVFEGTEKLNKIKN